MIIKRNHLIKSLNNEMNINQEEEKYLINNTNNQYQNNSIKNENIDYIKQSNKIIKYNINDKKNNIKMKSLEPKKENNNIFSDEIELSFEKNNSLLNDSNYYVNNEKIYKRIFENHQKMKEKKKIFQSNLSYPEENNRNNLIIKTDLNNYNSNSIIFKPKKINNNYSFDDKSNSLLLLDIINENENKKNYCEIKDKRKKINKNVIKNKIQNKGYIDTNDFMNIINENNNNERKDEIPEKEVINILKRRNENQNKGIKGKESYKNIYNNLKGTNNIKYNLDIINLNNNEKSNKSYINTENTYSKNIKENSNKEIEKLKRNLNIKTFNNKGKKLNNYSENNNIEINKKIEKAIHKDDKIISKSKEHFNKKNKRNIKNKVHQSCSNIINNMKINKNKTCSKNFTFKPKKFGINLTKKIKKYYSIKNKTFEEINNNSYKNILNNENKNKNIFNNINNNNNQRMISNNNKNSNIFKINQNELKQNMNLTTREETVKTYYNSKFIDNNDFINLTKELSNENNQIKSCESQVISGIKSFNTTYFSGFYKSDLKLLNKVNLDMPVNLDLFKEENDNIKEQKIPKNNGMNKNEIVEYNNDINKYIKDKDEKIEKLESFIYILNNEEEVDKERFLIENKNKSNKQKILKNTKNDKSKEEKELYGSMKDKDINNVKIKSNFYDDININNESEEENKKIKIKKSYNSYNIDLFLDINNDLPNNDQDFLDNIELKQKDTFKYYTNREINNKDDINKFETIKEMVTEYEFNLNEGKFCEPLQKYEDKLNFNTINPF